MRSRYAAYVHADLDYLYETSGPQVRKEFDAESTRKWAESAKWHGLEVLATSGGGEGDECGTVEFIARYEVGERMCNHHEVAEFVRGRGIWIFKDGRVLGPAPHRREEPRIGRNDLCFCGSGKKYKRCCEGSPMPDGPAS